MNETFSEKTLSDINEKRKKIKLNDNIMNNAKLKSIDLNPYNKNNRSTYNNSKNKIYLSKINKSKSNNKSSSINSKIFGKILGNIVQGSYIVHHHGDFLGV